MFNEELERKIKELEKQLDDEEEKYVNSVKSRQDYNTLKSIRNHIHDIKHELEKLYVLRNERTTTAANLFDLYIQLANHKGVKSTKVSALIAKTVSELSHAEQIKILDGNDAESLEKIFVNAYENKIFEVCRTIKEIMDK